MRAGRSFRQVEPPGHTRGFGILSAGNLARSYPYIVETRQRRSSMKLLAAPLSRTNDLFSPVEERALSTAARPMRFNDDGFETMLCPSKNRP